MRILRLEMKRVLKTRSTLILAAAALLLSLLLTYNVIQGERIYDRSYTPLYTGVEAIRKGHEIDAPYEGLILPEKLLAANEAYTALSQSYGGAENIPEDVYQANIWGIREYINLVGAVTNDPETGLTQVPENRSPADILNFYQNRDAFVAEKLAGKELKNDPAGLAKALSINAQVETPFVYRSYRGWGNGIENTAILVFLLTLICATIAAPIFSSEYQTGSDHILRCTRHGRTRLAISKLVSAALLSAVLFSLCMAVITGLLSAVLGAEGLKTSLQMMLPTAIAPMTLGQVNWAVMLFGLATLLATTCFTLFVSAKSRAPITALIIAVVVILLPTILRALAGGNLAQWVRFCLPSGGTGFGSSVYYELTFSTNFLRIGSLSFWSPYVIGGAALVNTLLFAFLSVHAYKRHEAL